ncbi:MAG: ComEC family competence protein [Bacteroidales bacterium]|nr:ComEC family competence protein [Bacteroidales bacterium]
MQYRHQFPMIRLLAPYMLGIILAIWLQYISLWIGPIILAFFFALVAWNSRNKRKGKYESRWIFGFLLSLCLILLGYQSLINHIYKDRPGHLSIETGTSCMVRISEPATEKERSWKLIAEVIAIRDQGIYKACSGNVLIYLSKDSAIQLPSYGDILFIGKRPVEVAPPSNPGSFNYRKYLESKGIYHQVYLTGKEWIIVQKNSSLSLKSAAVSIRDYLLNILKNTDLKGEEFGVAATLILGYDDELDYSTRKEYSSAGVVHILGISGLHVGIIYLVLNMMLGFLDRIRHGKYIKLVLILVLIWFYAFITGLSPAAQRAAAMFTFVVLGNTGKRNVHIINSLATSAFFLLLMDPYLITNIGFQFSYLSVCGIVLIYEYVYRIWQPKSWWIDKIWSLTAMSLVAQWVTFPLSLYYFHQFPVYFLPANLLVIPLSNLVIYSGMGVLATSFIPWLCNIIALITSYMVTALNGIAHFIDSLPYSLVPNLYLTMPRMLLIYGCIIAISSSLILKRKTYFKIAFCLWTAFCLLSTFDNLKFMHQNKIVVYHINKHTAIGFINGRSSLLHMDSLLSGDIKSIDFNLGGSRTFFGLKDITYHQLTFLYEQIPKSLINGQILQYQNKKIGLIKGLPLARKCASKLTLDYLVITGNQWLTLDQLLKYYSPEMIILDGSVATSRCNKYIESCKKKGIPYWSTREKGAFIADLR